MLYSRDVFEDDPFRPQGLAVALYHTNAACNTLYLRAKFTCCLTCFLPAPPKHQPEASVHWQLVSHCWSCSLWLSVVALLMCMTLSSHMLYAQPTGTSQAAKLLWLPLHMYTHTFMCPFVAVTCDILLKKLHMLLLLLATSVRSSVT